MQASPSPVQVKPAFRLAVSLADLVPLPTWTRARDAALAALRGQEAVAVLGGAGTGKTLLLLSLAEALRAEGWHVASVARAADVRAGLEGDALLVDEAGELDADAFAVLCAAKRPFVLAALPEFEARVAEAPRRITAVTLEPLAPEEVAQFVSARLAATGRPGDLFQPAAIEALTRHSGGVPRLLNILAGAAMFFAEHEGMVSVTRGHVDEAARMRRLVEEEEEAAPALPPPPPPVAAELDAPRPPEFWRRRRVLAGAAAVALLLAGAWAIWGHRASKPSVSEMAASVPVSLPPPLEAPAEAPPARAGAASPTEAVLTFQGPVLNETMHQGGQLSLVVHRNEETGAVAVQFRASSGLSGSGELFGTMSADGQMTASGRLMMGHNPFECRLRATLAGSTLTGAATFVHAVDGWTARSTFTLGRRA